MNKSGAVLIATPHQHFGNGLCAIVRSADPARTVLQTQDCETATHLLQTTHFGLLIVDAVLLNCLWDATPDTYCLALVHSARQERAARARQVSGIIYTSVTTQELTMQMQDWLSGGIE